jgi:hypothetical protein
MEQRRHLGDDVVSEESREDEDVETEQQLVRHGSSNETLIVGARSPGGVS